MHSGTSLSSEVPDSKDASERLPEVLQHAPQSNLTLQCHSEAGFGSFALIKDEGLSPPLRLEGQQSPDFPLGHVSQHQGLFQ